MACFLPHWRVAAAVAAPLIAGLLVAACSGASLPSLSGALPSWFASSDRAAPPPSTPAAIAAAAALENDCPILEIRRGASTLAIATRGEGATAADLRYQLTFHQLARQCIAVDGMVRMRVGIQGRVIVGPAGAPPEVTVPIRYAVVREGVEPKTITTKFRRFSVAVPRDGNNVLFTDIEEDLTFPMPPLVDLQAYVVYVGYDNVADAPPTRPAKKG